MRRGGSGGQMVRLGMALVVALISVCGFFFTRSENPITGEVQHVDLTPQEEIALGLQAAPEMIDQHQGLHPDTRAQALVDEIGLELVNVINSAQNPYRFEFHLLADPQTINAFALPGGQVFITQALFQELETEGELAGVLGHEIGHVVERHSAQRIAKQKLTEGLTGAAVLATYDPDDPSTQSSAAFAMMIGQLVNMRFGREDELESDRWGVRLLADAGYDPRAMIGVMQTLAEANQGQAPPEFFSTHPNPERRIERIQEAIAQEFPDGVPPNLIP